VVLEGRANGEIPLDGDFVGRKMLCRTDSTKEEDLRGADCAGGDDYLAFGFDVERGTCGAVDWLDVDAAGEGGGLVEVEAGDYGAGADG